MLAYRELIVSSDRSLRRIRNHKGETSGCEKLLTHHIVLN